MNGQSPERKAAHMARLRVELELCTKSAGIEAALAQEIYNKLGEIARLRESAASARRTAATLASQHRELLTKTKCPTCNKEGTDWHALVSERNTDSVQEMLKGASDDDREIASLSADVGDLREQLRVVEGSGVRRIEIATEIRLLD